MPQKKKLTSTSLKKADYELLADFRYRLRKFLGFSEAAAIARGVTPQQYQALLAIQGFPGKDWVTVGELADQIQVAHHSAGGLVRRMEALGLTERETSSQDRRCVRIRLTRKGLKILSKLIHVHRNELRHVGPDIVTLLEKASAAD